MRTIIWLSALLMLLLCAIGCSKDSGDDSKVTQIVFLDRENICPNVRPQIDRTWDAVTTLAQPRGIKITRVYMDTQGSLARKYTNLEPTTVPPGVYFLTRKGELITKLQGIMDEGKISEALEMRLDQEP